MSNPDIFRNVEGLVKQDSNIIAGLNFEFKGFVPEITSVDVERGRHTELRDFFGDSYTPRKVTFILDNNQPRIAVVEGIQTDINSKYSASGEFLSSNFPQKPFVRMFPVNPNDKQVLVHLRHGGLRFLNSIRLGLGLEFIQASSIRQPGTVEVEKIWATSLLIELKQGKLIPQK